MKKTAYIIYYFFYKNQTLQSSDTSLEYGAKTAARTMENKTKSYVLRIRHFILVNGNVCCLTNHEFSFFFFF